MAQKSGSLAMPLLKFASLWDCKIEGCGIDLKFNVCLHLRVGRSVPILFDLHLVCKEHTHTHTRRHLRTSRQFTNSNQTQTNSECASLRAICLECADRFLEVMSKATKYVKHIPEHIPVWVLVYQSFA